MSASQRPVSVVVPLPPTYRGGTEEYAYRLVERFARSYPVTTFATTVRYTPETGQIPTGSARIRLLRAREVMERPLLTGWAARRELLNGIRSSAVVQLHMPFPLVEGPATRVSKRSGVPAILTYHMDADLSGARTTPGASSVTRLYRRLSAFPALERCDAVVSNSRGYAETSPVLSRFLPKVRVIPKGIDLERLGLASANGSTQAAPSLLITGAPNGAPTLLFVGRLIPYKGVGVLLEAAHTLQRNGVGFRLLIAGRGPLDSELRTRAADLGLADRVRFLGFVPDSELGSLYRSVDLVCVPSMGRLESSSTSLEEAAALGTSVVGSDLPGASETVPNDGRRGLLVPPGDPSKLAEAITKMLAQGRPPAPEKVRTWDDVARDYWNLFREMGAALPEPAFDVRSP